ncbi:MAG TPA: glycoside hydrolase family 88 protein [Phycisphaerae bacterium]|nr:glycoside hydrolase family 88 protein [Phycisphaerae bacterium]
MNQFNRICIPVFLALAGCQVAYHDAAAVPVAGAATPAAESASAKPSVPSPYWGKWEDKNNPVLLGNKVVDDLIPREFSPSYAQRGGMDYREVCAAYGSVRFAGLTGDKDRMNKLIKRYEVFFTQDGSYLVPPANNVDNSVFGILPMEIYRQNGMKEADKKWLELGKKSADTEWLNPQPDGLTRFSRYWIDDMFMITALQAEAHRVTKDKVYMDRAAKEMIAYINALQKPNGLYFHGTDSPFYWSRGNGWMSAGSAELLSILPADHPDRPKILEGYKKMMAGLLKYQNKDGMWRQLIDIESQENWDETSGTGMFVFGMAMGVRNGWLDEATYKEPTKKAWLALATHLAPDGKVRDCCVGTNKGFSLEYYLTRQRATGDYHGQAAFIWAAWAMAMEPAK